MVICLLSFKVITKTITLRKRFKSMIDAIFGIFPDIKTIF